MTAAGEADLRRAGCDDIDAARNWLAWCDGSALPNPGRIGIGIVLVAPDGARRDASRVLGCCGCSNEAELRALCAALDMALEAGARRLEVRGDSDVALGYVRGPGATRIERLNVLVVAARERMRRFEHVELLWVPRHRNVEADRLAREALGLAAAPVSSAKGRRRRR